MKRIIFRLAAAAAVCAALFACDKKPKEDAFEGVSQEVVESIRAQAKINFPSNKPLAEAWGKKQVSA